jgi:CRISPR-associated endonuclease Cas3-HD
MIGHPYSWCDEELVQHAKSAKEIFGRCFERRTAVALKVKLKLTSPVDSIALIGRLVTILHDAGKAHPYYQQKFERHCVDPQRNCNECKKKPTFFAHEVFSSYMTYRLIVNLPTTFWRSIDEMHFLARLGALAILEHHQTIRRLDDILNVPFDAGPWKHEYAGDLLGLLPEIDGSTLTRIQDEEPMSLQEISRRLLRSLRDAQIANRARLKLYCLLLGPLCICDNASARLSRPSKMMTPFVCESCFALKDLREYMQPRCSVKGFTQCRFMPRDCTHTDTSG